MHRDVPQPGKKPPSPRLRDMARSRSITSRGRAGLSYPARRNEKPQTRGEKPNACAALEWATLQSPSSPFSRLPRCLLVRLGPASGYDRRYRPSRRRTNRHPYCLCQSPNDPEQQYFADGLTEDLTTQRLGISHLVIARSSVLGYRAKWDVARVWRDLGVALRARCERTEGRRPSEDQRQSCER